jgi:hypothetical protein
MGADTDASGVAFRFLKKMLKERAKGRVTVTSYDAKARSDTEQRVVFCRRSKRRNYAIRIQRR